MAGWLFLRFPEIVVRLHFSTIEKSISKDGAILRKKKAKAHKKKAKTSDSMVSLSFFLLTTEIFQIPFLQSKILMTIVLVGKNENNLIDNHC